MTRAFKLIATIAILLTFLGGTVSYAEVSGNYIVIDSTKPLEKQLLYANSTYEIRSIVHLRTDFSIPDNCTLIFSGGSIVGSYVLRGANTQIRAGEYDNIFKGVSCKGKWHCEKASICWWGAIDSYQVASNGHGYLANKSCDIAIERCLESTFPVVYFPVGCWYITKTIQVKEHKDFLLAGGPAVKSYYLNELVYNNNIHAANIYTDKNITVFSFCYNGEEVFNFHGGSIDVSQVYLKNKSIYNESIMFFDLSGGCQIIQASIQTHMINYQDENTFFNNNSRGVLFRISGSNYSFASDVTISCKINGFGTGIETSREKNANKSSWITDLKLNSYIRKSRTAIKLQEGDGTVINGSLQSTAFFDKKGGSRDKDKYPFVDISCRFVQVNASIWDVNSQYKDKWSNGIAIRIQDPKRTYDISESIISQYEPKNALVLP
jgi:hypothetical protein